MNRFSFVLTAFLIAPSVYSQWGMKPGKWETVRYTWSSPAKNWEVSPPLGNGRLAARALCNVKNETIFLNENTFWAGRPYSGNDPNALNVLKEVRKLLLAGRNPEADDQAKKLQGRGCQPYIATGNLFLDFDHGGSSSNYKSVLNMDSAMVQVYYTADGAAYSREMFISYPDQVMVIRLSTSKSGGLGFTVRMNSIDVDNLSLPHWVKTEGNDMLVMTGFSGYGIGYDELVSRPLALADTSDMKFDARLKVKLSGGSASSSGSSLKVSGADTAVLILSIATSYNGPFKHPSPTKEGLNPTPIAKDYLDKAAVKSYQELLTAHLKDYQGIFRRLWIEVNGENPGQRALDFQYARFELLQGSRGANGQPMALKGIWNEKNRPEWGAYYTVNSEGPKPYWAAESGNLAESIDPVTNFVEELSKSGAETAKTNYGCRGWVAHHNVDIWKTSTMAGGKGLGTHYCCWMFGGVIMAGLLSEHYKFSGDLKYLRERAYPVLKGAAQFCLDWLVDDGHGKLTTAPSSSPENPYVFTNGSQYGACMGSTSDLSLTKQLFQDVIAFSKALGVDEDFRKSLDSAYRLMTPFKVGSRNQLQEWAQDWPEGESQHRHASHLVAVFPLSCITARGTPDFFKAARKSIELRGKGSGGHMPSKCGVWARLLNGDEVLYHYDWLNNAFGGTPNKNGPTRYTRPYGGFPEMLLQSHAGELELLPALPSTWKSGKVLGLRGRMGYEVDIEWADKKLTKTTIRSSLGTVPIVRIQGDSVPDPKNDPRIDLQMVPVVIGGKAAAGSAGAAIDLTRLSNIVIPYRGQYSASVVTIRGQVVESVRGRGPATVRLVNRNWSPGLYVLKIIAADGRVAAVKKVNHTRKE